MAACRCRYILAGLLLGCFCAGSASALELIVNGNFETTGAGHIPNWVTSANPSPYNPTQHSGVIQHGGGAGVVVVAPGNSLGGYNNSVISQSVAVPRDALGATLTVYYDWYISYIFGSQLYAEGTFGGIQLFREQGNGMLIQPTPTPGWTRVDKYLELSTFGGQNVQLVFRATDDGISDATFIRLDDATLNVITATKTATPTITPTRTVTRTPTITPTRTISPTITMTSTISPTISPTPTITPYAVPGGEAVAFPNPAAGDSVTFMYSLGEPADIDVDVYNVLGRKVAHLEDKNQAGLINRRTTWDISGVAPGVYLYQVTIKTLSGQMTRLKMQRLVITK